MAKYNWRTHKWKTMDRFRVNSPMKEIDHGRSFFVDSFDDRGIMVTTISSRDEIKTRYFHPAECIPIRKLERREWWINERRLRSPDEAELSLTPWKDWFEDKKGPLIRTTRPKNTDGWIHVVEKKVK